MESQTEDEVKHPSSSGITKRVTTTRESTKTETKTMLHDYMLKEKPSKIESRKEKRNKIGKRTKQDFHHSYKRQKKK